MCLTTPPCITMLSAPTDLISCDLRHAGTLIGGKEKR